VVRVAVVFKCEIRPGGRASRVKDRAKGKFKSSFLSQFESTHNVVHMRVRPCHVVRISVVRKFTVRPGERASRVKDRQNGRFKWSFLSQLYELSCTYFQSESPCHVVRIAVVFKCEIRPGERPSRG